MKNYYKNVQRKNSSGYCRGTINSYFMKKEEKKLKRKPKSYVKLKGKIRKKLKRKCTKSKKKMANFLKKSQSVLRRMIGSSDSEEAEMEVVKDSE